MSVLVLCASCRRHVRRDDPSCPFCSATVFGDAVPPAPAWRMTRGAAFAFASSVALAGCSSESVPVYGAPSPDAATDADTGAVGPVYGAPADTGGAVDDTGGAMPLYGAAPDK
jgi:hypothetical protein